MAWHFTSFLRLARFIGAVCAVALSAWFPSASAATATRTPFQTFKSFGCANVPGCTLNPLRVAPTDAHLEVVHVTCHYATYPPTTRILSALISIYNKNGDEVFEEHLIPVLAIAADYAYTDATEQTFLIVPAGGRMKSYVTVPNASDIRFDCGLSGDVVKP